MFFLISHYLLNLLFVKSVQDSEREGTPVFKEFI